MIYPWLKQDWARLQEWRAKLPHALLFIGPKGIGKLALARHFAADLLCTTQGAHACGLCHRCHLFNAGNHPDLMLIEPEKDLIKIDLIRNLTESLTQTAQQGGMRVVILSKAHQMNKPAANALLKTLEEPGPNILFLLLTDEPSLLFPTIRSRCQALQIRVDRAAAKQWLNEEGSDAAIPLLPFTQYAPLMALEWARSNYLAQIMQMGEDLLGLSNLDTHPLQVAANWQQEPLSQVVFNWQSLVFALVQHKLGWPSLIPALTQLATHHSLLRLMKFYDRLLGLQRHLKTHLNPNPQLALEELLVTWG